MRPVLLRTLPWVALAAVTAGTVAAASLLAWDRLGRARSARAGAPPGRTRAGRPGERPAPWGPEPPDAGLGRRPG